MGGGGAMRAAAKVAGISVFSNSFRGTPSAAENPVTVAARKAVRPVCSGLSSITSTSELNNDQTVQKAVWEFDDWEFSGSEDEFVVDRNNVNEPRLVFGSVPTLDETKEATSELKDALDQVYLSSPKSCGTELSVSDAPKACITHESSPPKSAMQAFKLLKESPVVQNVVASIACDPNVWHAVMQNPSVVEFLESEKKSTVFESPELHRPELSKSSSVDPSDSNKFDEPDGLMAFLENVKVTVVDMVQYLTNLVESWFSSPKVEQKEGYVDEKFSQNYVAGGSFMALAMMVIMVVVLKR